MFTVAACSTRCKRITIDQVSNALYIVNDNNLLLINRYDEAMYDHMLAEFKDLDVSL